MKGAPTQVRTERPSVSAGGMWDGALRFDAQTRNPAPLRTLASERSAMDIARGEQVEADLSNLITRRHDKRVKDEGERQLEEAWRESERRAEARRREENRGGWLSWYRRLERGYLERAAACGRSADALERSVDDDERKSA